MQHVIRLGAAVLTVAAIGAALSSPTSHAAPPAKSRW
jgi:hypothetical protein